MEPIVYKTLNMRLELLKIVSSSTEKESTRLAVEFARKCSIRYLAVENMNRRLDFVMYQ